MDCLEKTKLVGGITRFYSLASISPRHANIQCFRALSFNYSWERASVLFSMTSPPSLSFLFFLFLYLFFVFPPNRCSPMWCTYHNTKLLFILNGAVPHKNWNRFEANLNRTVYFTRKTAVASTTVTTRQYKSRLVFKSAWRRSTIYLSVFVGTEI